MVYLCNLVVFQCQSINTVLISATPRWLLGWEAWKASALLFFLFRYPSNPWVFFSPFLTNSLETQIGILVPRRGQSRADGAVGTGESLRCPIASPYSNTLLIFILSDTSFFTPSRRSLWCVPFFNFFFLFRHLENVEETVFVLILKSYYNLYLQNC
jgi:hypothetical protein